jgi:hypothetical protein
MKTCFRISIYSTLSLLYYSVPYMYVFCAIKDTAHKLRFQGYKKWFKILDTSGS